MRPARVVGMIALVFGVLLLATGVAMYYINPFQTASADPRLRILGYSPFRMPSLSMAPTLRENQIFMVSAVALRDRDPRVGEIVVFQFPPNPQVSYVKRVVATGGSTIEMRKGVVYLDGKLLPEPYLPEHPQTEIVLNGVRVRLPPEALYADLPPTRVPEGHFFVLGDNRGNSMDSRFWGTVPRDHVIGVYQP